MGIYTLYIENHEVSKIQPSMILSYTSIIIIIINTIPHIKAIVVNISRSGNLMVYHIVLRLLYIYHAPTTSITIMISNNRIWPTTKYCEKRTKVTSLTIKIIISKCVIHDNAAAQYLLDECWTSFFFTKLWTISMSSADFFLPNFLLPQQSWTVSTRIGHQKNRNNWIIDLHFLELFICYKIIYWYHILWVFVLCEKNQY